MPDQSSPHTARLQRHNDTKCDLEDGEEGSEVFGLQKPLDFFAGEGHTSKSKTTMQRIASAIFGQGFPTRLFPDVCPACSQVHKPLQTARSRNCGLWSVWILQPSLRRKSPQLWEV